MRTLSATPTGDSPQIAILPWLQLDSPVTFADVTIFPRAAAMLAARSFQGFDVSQHVKYATSYFASGARYPRSVALDSTNLLDRDVVPELVEPSVIFLDEQTTLTRVDDVLAALNFACIAANAEGSYTNAVVFERYIQTLVARPDYVVPVSRQMFGSKATGTPAINLLATRPHRCGEFHQPQRDHWEALEGAIDSPAAIRVMDAIRPLVAATQDLETIPEDLERSLYAIALERLLALTSTEKAQLKKTLFAERIARGVRESDASRIANFTLHRTRGENLLKPLLGAKSRPIGESGYHIMCGWEAIRRRRNAVWHADERDESTYDFENQFAVRFNLIWFRVTQALIIASLVEAGLADANGSLALAVMGIEAWLGSIKKNDNRPPDVASATNTWWSTARVCYKSILQNRDSGEWRDYFSDTGSFVLPARRNTS